MQSAVQRVDVLHTTTATVWIYITIHLHQLKFYRSCTDVLPLLHLVRYEKPDRPDHSSLRCSYMIHGKYQLQSVYGNCARHWIAVHVLMCAKVSMLCRHSSGTVCVLSALVSRWGLVARCCPGDEIKGVPGGGCAACWLTAIELIYVSDACALDLDAVYRFVIQARLSPPNSPCSYSVHACLA